LFGPAALVNGVAAFPVYWIGQSGNSTPAAIAPIRSVSVLWPSMYGSEAASFCELFETRVRYTGVSLVYQIDAIIVLTPIPILAALLVGGNGNRQCWLATYVLLACVGSALSPATMRRTSLVPALAAAPGA